MIGYNYRTVKEIINMNIQSKGAVDLLTHNAEIDKLWNFRNWIRRTINAQDLMDILTNSNHTTLKFTGVHIKGNLNLISGCITAHVQFDNCVFEGVFDCKYSKVQSVIFNSCLLTNFDGDNADFQGLLRFRDCTVTNSISAMNSKICGGLSVSGTSVNNPLFHNYECLENFLNKNSICFDGASFTGIIDFEGGNEIWGISSFKQIKCMQIQFEYTNFISFYSYALILEGAEIKSSLILENTCCVYGKVGMSSLQVIGDVDFRGLTIQACLSSSPCIQLDSSVVEGTLFFSNGISVIGTTMALGISSQSAVFNGGYFRALSDPSFNDLNNSVANSICLDRSIIKKTLQLNKGFTSYGSFRANGITVNGNIECVESRFLAPKGEAFNIDSSFVDGNIIFDKETIILGSMNLTHAYVGGMLSINNTYLIGGIHENGRDISFAGEKCIIKGTFRFFPDICFGIVNLQNANIGTLDDDINKWPELKVILQGLLYENISWLMIDPNKKSVTDISLKDRINWMKNEYSGYQAQPYEHFAAYLNRVGRVHDAITVKYESEVQKNIEEKNEFKQTLGVLHQLASGFGYKPARILIIFFLITQLSYVLFQQSFEHGSIFPSSPLIYNNKCYTMPSCDNWSEVPRKYTTEKIFIPTEYEAYSPYLHSLDIIVPLLDFNQNSNWSVANNSRLGKFLIWFSIILQVIGWLSLTALISSVVKIINKN